MPCRKCCCVVSDSYVYHWAHISNAMYIPYKALGGINASCVQLQVVFPLLSAENAEDCQAIVIV